MYCCKQEFLKPAGIRWLTVLGILLFSYVSALSAATVNLAWDPSSSSDVGGYNLYYKLKSDNSDYVTKDDAGNNTTDTLTLPDDSYCFVVTAYDTTRTVESGPSNEVCAAVGSQTSPPIADFSASPTSGTAPLAVRFTDASTGDTTSRSWDFGDGSTSTATNPSHSYSTPGTYTVTLTATGAGGSDQAIKGGYISVTSPSVQPPVDDFSGSPTSGLVAAYGFETTTDGQVVDSSGQGNTGTISGAVESDGKFGKALSFNGTDNWVTVGDSAALDLTDEMTLEAWVYPTDISHSRTVLAKESGSDSVYYLYANDIYDTPLGGGVFSGQLQYVYGGSALAENTWSHVAVTYDGATERLYVNGSQVASKAQTGSMGVSDGPLRIGGSMWGEYFAGRIDEVRVYSRALSADEIQSDMVSPVMGSNTQGLVAAYGFETTTDGKVVDSSGQGNTGTISGAVESDGKFGKALFFNGTDNWVTVGDSAALDLTDAITLEAWVYPTDISLSRTVLAKESGSDSVYYLYANDIYDTPLGGGVFSGQLQYVYGGSTLAENTWSHVAVTYDGATERLYVNGSQVASKAQTGSMGVSDGPLRIGSSMWGEYFAGRIDEVRVYSRALSADEIQSDMVSPVVGSNTPVIDNMDGVLLDEDFAGGSLNGWTVVDEGSRGGTSSWSAASGALVQSGNILGGSFDATTLPKPGTYALYNGGSGWTDYEATFSARSDDNDEFGLMFRVLDSNNYYRFSWNAEFGYRRLVKNVDGVFMLLAEEAIPYVPGHTYQVGVTVDADLITVQIDDEDIFSVIDTSISKGSIAAYSWADAGVSFDDISVTAISTSPSL